MEYIPIKTKAELLKRFAIESNKGKENMFVEGLMYSENTAVIMLGNMTDHAESGKVLGYSFEYLYLMVFDIYTVNLAHVVTAIKQSLVLKGQLFLLLS